MEASTDKLLRVFDEAGVRGTFFVLGWVADRYPELIRRIARGGHELASHGYWHQLVYDVTPEAFAQDVLTSKAAIADAAGIEVTAYRAPSFSITQGYELEDALATLRRTQTHRGATSQDVDIGSLRYDVYGLGRALRTSHRLSRPNSIPCPDPKFFF